MTLHEIGQEFWRPVEDGSRLKYRFVRRSSWPLPLAVEIFAAGENGPKILTLVKCDGRDNNMAFLSMNLWDDNTSRVILWCPSAEDVLADDWYFMEPGT